MTTATVTATPRTTSRKESNFYFTFEFRSFLRTCSSRIWNDSVQFQLSHCRSRSPKYAELSYFTLTFCRGRQRNESSITHVHSTCTCWWRSHCRCRRGVLKLCIMAGKETSLLKVCLCDQLSMFLRLLICCHSTFMANNLITMRSSGRNKLKLCS